MVTCGFSVVCGFTMFAWCLLVGFVWLLCLAVCLVYVALFCSFVCLFVLLFDFAGALLIIMHKLIVL